MPADGDTTATTSVDADSGAGGPVSAKRLLVENILQSAGRLTESESQKLGVEISSYVNCIASSAEADDAVILAKSRFDLHYSAACS